MNTAAPARHLSIDALDRAIVNLAGRINAATCELLVLVREFDERAGFLRWGFESCAEWLHWRCDLSLNAAREKVRVAHALKSLPQMSRAFERGALSYSKVRALTRVASRENECALLAFAMTTTAMRVEERCRQMRNVLPESTTEARHAHRQRALRAWRDGERGMMTLTVELPIEEGELICRALDRAIENEPANGPEFESVSWHAQQADALVAIAKRYLGGSAEASSARSPDNYQIIVHTDESALREGKGRSDLPIETIRRLTCDGSIVPMTDGANGEPLDVGRKQRIVPTAIRRALIARDGGCSFPGCARRHFVDAHHVRHWSQGGETSLANTLLLCSAHHRLVHEDGYTIHRDERDRWYFRRPDGRAIPEHGYRPEDMHDDDADTSAETSSVREPRGRYRVVSMAC